MEQRVIIEVSGGIAQVRLNRPDKLNALDADMFGALVDAGEALARRGDLRVAVVSGAGASFCAGLDMGLFRSMGSGDGLGPAGPTQRDPITMRTHGIANRPQRMATVWTDAPFPVIAAIRGCCFGGGLQVALGADIRIVATDARLSMMEIRWGLVPDMAGFALARHLLRGDVFAELVYTGREVSGEEAVRIGLATRVAADPLAEALALATEIARKSPDAVRASKRLLAHARSSDAATVLYQESIEQEKLIGSANQMEAVRANVERRPPEFRDPA